MHLYLLFYQYTGDENKKSFYSFQVYEELVAIQANEDNLCDPVKLESLFWCGQLFCLNKWVWYLELWVLNEFDVHSYKDCELEFY